MRSKNFKNTDDANFKLEPAMTLGMVEAEEKRLDLRNVDSSVLRLVEANQKKVKDLFDNGLL